MRQLSFLALLVMLIILPSCKYFSNWKLFGKKERARAELLARQDSIRVADSLRNVLEEQARIEAARLDSIRRADEERLAAESRYNIIVGSFVTPEYADNLVKEYTGQGYNARLVKMEGSKFQLVVAESHKNLRQAVQRLQAYQDTVQPDSWIYTRK